MKKDSYHLNLTPRIKDSSDFLYDKSPYLFDETDEGEWEGIKDVDSSMCNQ